MPSISVVVGNPKPASRTRDVAEELAGAVSRLTGAPIGAVVDLADHAPDVFRWPAEALDEISGTVSRSEIAIFATPTYKASYTGLLKAFLDRYPSDGLAGVTAIPVFTIGSDAHALAVEFTLRPLLVELGASVPTRGLAFPTSRFEEREAVIDEWLSAQGRHLAR
ncbi:NAD(P)H-dependent oxidoreductase [Leucobacter weissii]|uniref:NAD(P)H-dependent oxidoreductase n=1 Tax=Leucobacter weissii TaxID=1983706 RepID=A0A939S7U2_9MICO|nr:NAD(P)H-dependent oxidoreductase [Leucobacter weissii]MBO1901346.1 NAD(P)H-dependent oxidoreductase [Leucobacter weissii]